MDLEETARAQPAEAGEHVRVEAANQDRLLSYGPFDYMYTANGELETKTNRETGDAWLFQYDALGNLRTVGLPHGDLVEYLVDGMGRRVGKKNGVLLKQWLYRDALKPVAELDGAGTLVSEVVYGSKSNVPDCVGARTYRVISDQLGSPRYVVNVANAGDVPFTASYTTFGEAAGTGLDWMPFGFAGGVYDGDTTAVRFGARDYDPSSGRWVTKDPARWTTLRATNFFAYASSDPINLSDPAGKDPTYSQCSQMATTDYNACIHGCESIVGEVCSLFGDSTQADCERSCKNESDWQLDLCDSLLGPKNPAQRPKPDSPPLDGPCWGWSCYAGL